MAIFRKKVDHNVPRRRLAQEFEREPARITSQNTFRRNRTLTGSTSNTVASSSHSQPDMLSKRSHVHNLARVRRRIGSILLVVILAMAFLYWLLTQLTAQVSVGFSDASISRTLDTSIYQKAINDYMGIHPFSRLRFMLDTTDLGQYLAATVPEVDSVVSAKMGSISETAFTLVMRKPIAGWKIGVKQYYVDTKGVAFERNFYGNPSVQIVDESGAALEQGALIASNQFLSFVGRVVALSQSKGYTVTDAILPAGTTRQLEIKLSGVTSLVKLSTDRSAGEQVEDMSRSLVYLAAHGQSPSYIDVRVSGKAFYQ